MSILFHSTFSIQYNKFTAEKVMDSFNVINDFEIIYVKIIQGR